jgi:RNA polymerase sigma factor (sigma-70 family)
VVDPSALSYDVFVAPGKAARIRCSAKQRIGGRLSLFSMQAEPARHIVPPGLRYSPGMIGQRNQEDAAGAALSSLYQIHALGLTRLAHVMLGDRAAAEDVVHDAFVGLQRNWHKLSDQAKAPGYLRSSVLNGCRTALRRDRRGTIEAEPAATVGSAETSALATEEQRRIMRAIRCLPHRQREVLILRFYLQEPEAEIARLMGIKQSTVRSTAHRALAALGRILEETP